MGGVTTCKLNSCKLIYVGKHNVFRIGRDCIVKGAIFYLGGGSTITIGDRFHVNATNRSRVVICTNENRSINIGDDCLFSDGIQSFTTDFHSVLKDNICINPSDDIKIGNHVWIGKNVMILKGTNIGDDCIVGACSVVTKKFKETNSIIAGNPALIRKKDVNWHR